MCPCCTQGKHQEPLPPVSKPQQRISDTLIQVGSQFTLTIPVDAEDDARAAIVDAHAPFSSHNQRQAAIEVWRD